MKKKNHLFKNPLFCRHIRHDFGLSGMTRHAKTLLFSRQKELKPTMPLMPPLLKSCLFLGGDIQKQTPQKGGLLA